MKLSIIEVKNLRGIKDSGKIFMNDFLLLVGANNSGKSTIMKALDLFFNNSEFDCENDYPISNAKKQGYRASTKIRLTFEREAKDKLPHQLAYYFINKRGFSNKILTIEIEYPREYSKKQERKITINNKYKGSDLKVDNRYNEIYISIKKYISYLYIPTERLGEKFDENKFINELIFLTLEKSNSYNKAFREYKLAIKNQFDEVENGIIKNLYGFPNLKKINFDFSEISLDNFKNGIKIYVLDGKKVLLEKEGAGLRSAITISIIKSIFNKTNKNKINFIVGIEEPENYLHPEAQRALINQIKRGQAIVSTHSPIILNELSPREFKNILRCYKNDKLNFFQLSTEADIKLLTRLYENSDIVGGEFFFSNLCILVEGKSDQLIFKKQLRLNNFYSSVILPVNGNTAFNNPIHLLNNFQIKIAIITDEDSLFGVNKNKFKQALINNGITSETSWSKLTQYAKRRLYKKNGITEVFKKCKELVPSLAGLIVIPGELEKALIDNNNTEIVLDWFISYGHKLGIIGKDHIKIESIKALDNIDKKADELKQLLITEPFKKRFITEQMFDLLVKKQAVPKIFSDIVKCVKTI